jgi:omega-amidase
MSLVPQEYLTISIVQQDIVWQNSFENLKKLELFMSSISSTDVIVLPEMFNVGFTMNAQQAVENATTVVAWMQHHAAQKKCAIVGSIPVKENNTYYNRLFWVEPEKTLHYDKRHLFRMANEHEHYSEGKEKLIINYKGWNICPLVCYDLRFPVWSRNTFTNGNYAYDVLIYVANWPEVRRKPWSTLLQARAIENLSYCVGVNRVGEDGNEILYSGDSAVYDYKGDKLSALEPNKEAVETIQLTKSVLTSFREKFPAGLDADAFELNL